MPPKGYVEINEVYCKGCGLCVAVCPQGALDLADRLTRLGYHPAFLKSDACTGCTNCAVVCPEAAIKVLRKIAVKDPAEEGGK